MARLEEYADRFQFAKLEREDGILQMTLHSDGDTLQWGAGPHSELVEVFHAVGADPETKVVIMTGAGGRVHRPCRQQRYSAPAHPGAVGSHLLGRQTPLGQPA